MTTKTKITLPITITLKDPRYCTGCHLTRWGRCTAFRTKDRGWSKILQPDRKNNHYKRLPQCIAATGGSDA